MPKWNVTRWLEFDAGHRVMRHGGKCRQLHGHRYKVGVVVSGDTLDEVGVIEDFGNLKSVFGRWLDTTFDHGMIFQEDDPWVAVVRMHGSDQKIALLPYPATAEGIARYLFEEWIGIEPRISKVIVYETPNCFAEWTNG